MNKLTVVMVLCCAAIPGCFWTNAPDSGGAIGTNNTNQTADGKLVFITRAKFGGNLGGLAGADSKCAVAASAAGFPGKFIAYLSTITVNAASRVTGSGPWNNTKGQRVFDAGAARWAGFPKATILDDSGKLAESYWTGSEGQGTSSLLHCNNWTEGLNDFAQGTLGNPLSNDGGWITFGVGSCARSPSALICLQND